MSYFIISANNKFYLYWKTINTFSCLTSSYIYAYMAAFERSSKSEELMMANNVYEIIFIISMLLMFFVDYCEEGSNIPVEDFTKIVKRYLKSQFLYDFVPILPLQELPLGGMERLFYLPKIIRLRTGIAMFDVPMIISKVKYFNKKKIDKIIETDKELAEDVIQDNNNIT